MYNCWNKALTFYRKQFNQEGKLKRHANADLVHKIDVLMKQYYYGIEAKKELWWCLVYDCRIIPEDKDPMLN